MAVSLRSKWSGRILRGGIAATPLFLVIALCIIMVGWRGNKSDAEITTPHPALAAHTDTNPASTSEVPMAAFQRLHVIHATVRVPQ